MAGLETGRAGMVRHLELSAPDGPPIDHGIRRVAVVALPDDPNEWQHRGKGFRLIEPPEADRRSLAVQGQGEIVVRVPLAPPYTDFNLVAIELRCPTTTTVSVQVVARGRPVHGSRGIRAGGSPEHQVLLFEFPQPRNPRVPYEELRVRFQSRGSVVFISRVELLEKDAAGFLPDPARGPEPVELHRTDARPAVGLSVRRPLEATFDAPRGSVLRLSYGLPATLRARSDPPLHLRLTLRAEHGGARQEHRLPLAWQQVVGGWTELELPLQEVAGGWVRLRLELECDSPGEVLLAIAEPRVLVPQAHPPTVLFVTSDTHRYDHVSASGRNVEVRTVNIDALAERGVYFTNCFTSANSTNPSHVAMLTGRHPRDTGVNNNHTPISSEAPTLARRFAESGYTTLAVLSARHLGHDTSGLGTGFDRISRPKLAQRRSPPTIDQLLEWAEALSDEPLFVWLHLFDAHTPYEPPPEYLEQHWPGERDPFDPELPLRADLPAAVFGPGGRYPGLRDLEFPRAQYRAEVDFLDAQLARVLDHPRLGTGVVALTADHGELLGHHGVYYDHAGIYPDSIHVPLVLAWPEGPQGVRVERAVSHLDIGRTLLDLAGATHADFPGRDLSAPLRGGPEPYEEPRFALAAHGFACSITSGEWHLVLHIVDNSPQHHDSPAALNERHKVELYNLALDPACEHDLVDEEHEVARRLREQLLRWLSNPEPTGWAQAGIVDQETIQQLAQLGYTTTDLERPTRDILWTPDSCEWCLRFEAGTQ